jgi:hypothetical protein
LCNLLRSYSKYLPCLVSFSSPLMQVVTHQRWITP